MFSELKKLANIHLPLEANELEKAKIITGYAHDLFTHNGDNEPSSFDPVTIIKEARAGKSFRCVEYSLLATALLWAYSIPTRKIGLKTHDVETRKYGAGHVVIEFWNSKLQKWIMCDVQWGLLPKLENVFLSAYELGQKISQNLTVEYASIGKSRFTSRRAKEYTDWVREYLYFFDTPTEIEFSDINMKEQQIVMLVPQGVAAPKMFQNMFQMNAVYTHSVLDFYSRPDAA